MTGHYRKRCYSQAFQLSVNSNTNHELQMPKTMRASSLSEFCRPTWLEGVNKENATPFDHVKTTAPVTPDCAQPEFHYPPCLTPYPLSSDPPVRGRPLQALTQLPYGCGQFSGDMLQPGPGGFYYPHFTTGHDNSTKGDVLGYNAGPGLTIKVHEDDFTMCDTLVSSGPSTPSALNMQDLSLADFPALPLPGSPIRHNRATVRIESSSYWLGTFAEVRPEDAIIIFDRGKQVVKVNKYPLCAASPFFTQKLNGRPLAHHVRVIRLRDDFPYAIRAMIEFIDTGAYNFRPAAMHTLFPNVTLLDFHIHAYLAGSKYDIPQLCTLAVNQYLQLGDMCLAMDADSSIAEPPSIMSLDAMNPPPSSLTGTTIVKGFLESLALLWRNTPDRFDTMRAAVLELVKYHLTKLTKLPFFATLLKELGSFSVDLEESLGDDGLEVQTYFLGEGEVGGVRFG